MAQWQRVRLQWRRHRFNPWVRKIPWRRKQQPTPVFLPGKSHGQRSLAGYSSWDCKDWTCAHTRTHTHRHAESESEGHSVVSNSLWPHVHGHVHIVHGILQGRILEWVAFPFFRGSSWPRDQTQVSCIAGRFFTSWATREAQECWSV